jgi:hypothetical protein
LQVRQGIGIDLIREEDGYPLSRLPGCLQTKDEHGTEKVEAVEVLVVVDDELDDDVLIWTGLGICIVAEIREERSPGSQV